MLAETPSSDATRFETRSTCPYCGVGCGVIIESQSQGGTTEITGVRGDPEHPANFGRLCSKGSSLHLTAQPLRRAQARALQPMIRAHRLDQLRETSWDSALNMLADRFAACIREHGPDSVAFYISGQLLTEDYYVFNKLAKGLIGTNNVDTNSRLCMSSAVAGYKQTLGADAPPNAYEDIDHADCLLIAGSNTAFAHPILFRRIEAAKLARPALKIIVVDPRRTDTAAFADLHLPILPGTDVALFHAMLNHLMWEGLIDRRYIDAHTEGFDALKALIRDNTPRWAAEICGVTQAAIVQAAEWFARAPASLSLYCQGLNQSASGTAKNVSLIHLHLATAQIGRPGAGPFSLTGQPNAMGGREVGGMANLLSAHRDLGNPTHREEVARLWSIASVPQKPGKTAVELFEAIGRGEIRMVWIACTNPAQSMPNLEQVGRALQTAELVVVQEAYHDTATTAFADVLLPATSWGEKDGTVTNSERRITRVRPALPAPGETRHDWAIASDFARRLKSRMADDDEHRAPGAISFDYADAQSIWNEHRETTRGRDLDITGLSYALLDVQGPQHWPYREGASRGLTRLYGDGRFATASGRARFVALTYQPVAEAIDARFPWRLTTGRLRDQWHGMSRTGTLGHSFGHSPEPVIEMSPLDLASRGLKAGQLVRVSSRRGRMVLPVEASESLRTGTVFIAMHWGAEFVKGLGVNALTSPAVDPSSLQPELKHCAVRIEAVELPHRALFLGWMAAEQVLAVRSRLMKRLQRVEGIEFANAVLFGRDSEGVKVRIASSAPLSAELIAEVEAEFLLEGLPMLRYQDAGQIRHAAIEEGRLRFFMLVGDQKSESWLAEMLEQELPVAHLGYRLLMPSAIAPGELKTQGRLICNCLGVSELKIRECAQQVTDPAARLLAVQATLGCGTQCGSCLPELRQLVWSETCNAQ